MRNSRDFNKHFTSAYLQHVAEIEGEDDMDGEDELSDAFVFLLADTEEEDQTQHSDAFFTSVEALLT